ncbi:MAG: hypothetical protein WC698_06390 [Candidatus Peribacteraceae bacterium]|jgi:hypothetical protein
MTNTQSSSEVLKIDTVGRVRTPKEKREETVAAYRGSGMTGQQFAAYSGVKYSTLMNWVGKARRAQMPVQEVCKTSELNWVEAMVEDGCSGQGEALSVEIGGTVRMRIVSSRQAALAGEIIRGLGVVRPC